MNGRDSKWWKGRTSHKAMKLGIDEQAKRSATTYNKVTLRGFVHAEEGKLPLLNILKVFCINAGFHECRFMHAYVVQLPMSSGKVVHVFSLNSFVVITCMSYVYVNMMIRYPTGMQIVQMDLLINRIGFLSLY